MTPCATPISFLRLERYQLGELSTEERREIDAHLAACDACKATLAGIAADDAAPLPALPLPVKKTAKVSFLRRAWPVAGAFAVAAAALLFLSKPGAEQAGDGDRVKGDGVSFGLVRDDETAFEEGGASFRDGDRFKVLVTCPPHARTRVDVVVWENGTPSFPLAADDIACGNKVPLPGAFRTTGFTPMIVCVLTSDAGLIDRELVRKAGSGGYPGATCKALLPVP